MVSLYREKFLRAQFDREPFEYASYLGGLFGPADDFGEVCAKIAKIPDRIADRHFISQDFWFEKVCRVRLDHVGHFEDLDREWASICRRIGLFVELPRVNPSVHIPFDRKAPGSLTERYAADFERFGYAP